MVWFSHLLSITDKLIPGRKEKLVLQLQVLEKELEAALAANDSLWISRVNKQIRKIRQRLENLK